MVYAEQFALSGAVAICCCLTENDSVILDPTKLEEQVLEFVFVVFDC